MRSWFIFVSATSVEMGMWRPVYILEIRCIGWTTLQIIPIIWMNLFCRTWQRNHLQKCPSSVPLSQNVTLVRAAVPLKSVVLTTAIWWPKLVRCGLLGHNSQLVSIPRRQWHQPWPSPTRTRRRRPRAIKHLLVPRWQSPRRYWLVSSSLGSWLDTVKSWLISNPIPNISSGYCD